MFGESIECTVAFLLVQYLFYLTKEGE